MNKEYYRNIRKEDEIERHSSELQKRYDSGFTSGLTMGFSMSVLILLGASTFILKPNKIDQLVDCGEGPNNGAFNFLVEKDEVFSTKAITGGDQITITGEDPGSLRIQVAENVIVSFPNQEISGGTEINLKPNSLVSLETNGIIMDVAGEPSGDSTKVSIDAVCKT